MSPEDVIRAWKSEEYRLSLPSAQVSTLPHNPAGVIELSDEDLGEVTGADTGLAWTTWICVGMAVSALLGCGQSVLHGTCSGLTAGCCS